jgi:hypothetical protein
MRESGGMVPLTDRELSAGYISGQEIAKIQSVSLNTIPARMRYALAKLCPLLRQAYISLD